MAVVVTAAAASVSEKGEVRDGMTRVGESMKLRSGKAARISRASSERQGPGLEVLLKAAEEGGETPRLARISLVKSRLGAAPAVSALEGAEDDGVEEDEGEGAAVKPNRSGSGFETAAAAVGAGSFAGSVEACCWSASEPNIAPPPPPLRPPKAFAVSWKESKSSSPSAPCEATPAAAAPAENPACC